LNIAASGHDKRRGGRDVEATIGGFLFYRNEQICRLRSAEETALSVKKKAEAIRQEISREVEQLPRTIFQGHRKTGHLDLKGIETAAGSAMYRAGAAALTELAQFRVPAVEHRSIRCGFGHQAHYRELRSKPHGGGNS
jgi:hypothetical protein